MGKDGVVCKVCEKRNLMWHKKDNGSWVLVEVHTCEEWKRATSEPEREAARW